jgi:hypothetical protein
MLLGCCHCGQTPPSESTPPSQSSSDMPPATTTYACTPQRCLNDTIPLKFGFSVAEPPGTSGICRAFYYGGFTLFYSPNTCYSFNSAEYAKRNQSGCSDYTSSPMWFLGISTPGGASTNFNLGAILFHAGFEVAIVYYTAAIARASNCVRSVTLTKISTDSLGYFFPNTVTVNVA